MILRSALLAVAASSASASTAPSSGIAAVDESRFVIVLRDLSRPRGTLVSLDERQVVWRTADGALEFAASEDVVGLVRADIAVPMPGQWLEFADGQRLPGRPSFSEGVLRWRHDALGLVPVDLDALSALVLDPSASRRRPERADIVELANGDRVEGIVAAIGATVVVERDDGIEQAIPFERIAVVSFVSVAPTESATWPVRVWLADGAALLAERPVVGDDGIVRLRPRLQASESMRSDRPLLLPLEAVTGVLLAPDAMTPLATLTPLRVESPPERLSARGPQVVRVDMPMGLSPIVLRGPIEVAYALPEPGLRFVATAVMPEAALAWGDLELVIIDGEQERLRRRVNTSEPMVLIDLVILGDRLVIRLEEGHHGPVQDVIVLREAMLGSTGAGR